MNIIYNECLGNNNLEYYAFISEDDQTSTETYGVCVRDCIHHKEKMISDLTCNRQKIIEFVETLIRNTVYPDFLRDIAEDYLLA
ncbi:MAG: DUF6514 family protein [Oscillospiraceae bacterium]|nr:DUF6514 family protein [Oscillospiraceae bacterium]